MKNAVLNCMYSLRAPMLINERSFWCAGVLTPSSPSFCTQKLVASPSFETQVLPMLIPQIHALNLKKKS